MCLGISFTLSKIPQLPMAFLALLFIGTASTAVADSLVAYDFAGRGSADAVAGLLARVLQQSEAATTGTRRAETGTCRAKSGG